MADENLTPILKWCHACRADHLVSDFGNDRTRPDSLRAICREADRKRGRDKQAKKSGENYRSWFADAPEGFITRRQALAAGFKEYSDGRPCAKGHVAPKRVDSYGCTECHKAIAKAWEAKGNSHPDRLEALAANLPTYPGEPCENGHQGLRATKSGRCVHCGRNRVEKWRVRHPEYDHAGMVKKLRAKDPTRHRAASSKWARANKEIVAAALKRWQAQNPERHAANQRVGWIRRRARKLENGGAFNADDIIRLFAEQDGHCACCGGVSDRLEIDHIMPVKLRGNNDPSNLQLLCFPCNRTKGSLHPAEWRRRLRLGIIIPKLRALL